MAFTIKLYNLKKRKNSTMRPSTSTLAATYSCTLKENTSILNPTFVIKTDDSLGNMLSQGRYIEAIYDSGDHYYYWLADMVSVCYGVWEVIGRLDVLATWKIEIGDTKAYIARTSAINNYDVVDPLELYGNFSSVSQQVISNPIPLAPNNGYYVLSLYNDVVNNFNEIGTNAYIVPTAVSLQAILLNIIYNNDKLFTNYYSNNKDVIAGIHYIPITYGQWSNIITVDVNANGVSFGSALAFRAGSNTIFDGTIDISLNRTQHNYRYHAPYLTFDLYLPYVGNIPLDDDLLGDNDAVRIKASYDVISGAVHYLVTAHHVGVQDDIIIGNFDTDISVAMPVSAGVDWYERTQYNVMQRTLNAVQSISGGNLAGAFSNMGQAASVPQTQHVIAQSSGMSKTKINATTNNIVLYTTKLARISNPDNYKDLLGTPLCEVREIKTLSGYVQCLDASVVGTGIDVRDEINAYLNGGFYYE